MVRKNSFSPFYIISFIGKPLSGKGTGNRGIVHGTCKIQISIQNAGNIVIGKKRPHVHLMEKYTALEYRAFRIGIHGNITSQLLSIHQSRHTGQGNYTVFYIKKGCSIS